MLCLYLILLIHLCLNMIYQYGSCGFHWFWVFGLIWHNSFMLFFWAYSWWMKEIEDLVFWVITVREKKNLKVSFVDIWGWLWLDNKSKALKWTKFLKTTNQEVTFPFYLCENNYIVIQRKRKKKNIDDIVIKTIVTVYWLVLLNFCVCVCDHALATSKICLTDDGEREEGYQASVINHIHTPTKHSISYAHYLQI